MEKVEDIMPVLDKYNKGYLSYPQLRSYLNSYSEEEHSSHIKEIKIKKKETVLNCRNTFKDDLPKLVLPYTESVDQLDPSFMFGHKVEEVHKI